MPPQFEQAGPSSSPTRRAGWTGGVSVSAAAAGWAGGGSARGARAGGAGGGVGRRGGGGGGWRGVGRGRGGRRAGGGVPGRRRRFGPRATAATVARGAAAVGRARCVARRGGRGVLAGLAGADRGREDA